MKSGSKSAEINATFFVRAYEMAARFNRIIEALKKLELLDCNCGLKSDLCLTPPNGMVLIKREVVIIRSPIETNGQLSDEEYHSIALSISDEKSLSGAVACRVCPFRKLACENSPNCPLQVSLFKQKS